MKDGRWIRREGGGCGKGEGERREPEGMFGKKSRLGSLLLLHRSLVGIGFLVPGCVWTARMLSASSYTSSSSSSIATISLLPLVYTGATPSICSRSPVPRSFCVQFCEPMQPTSLSLSLESFPDSHRIFRKSLSRVHKYPYKMKSRRPAK